MNSQEAQYIHSTLGMVQPGTDVRLSGGSRGTAIATYYGLVRDEHSDLLAAVRYFGDQLITLLHVSYIDEPRVEAEARVLGWGAEDGGETTMPDRGRGQHCETCRSELTDRGLPISSGLFCPKCDGTQEMEAALARLPR